MINYSWKVNGMTCATCALSINTYLSQQGAKNIQVDFINGEIFCSVEQKEQIIELEKGVADLGYTKQIQTAKTTSFYNKESFFLLCCLILTLPFFIGMIPLFGSFHHHFLTPKIQLILTLPIYIIGMYFFGKSAFKSILKKRFNMNVLISLGASLAFFYSIYLQFILNQVHFLFYETTATIITLVLLGNLIEHQTVKKTQKSIEDLVKIQTINANLLIYNLDGSEHSFGVEANTLKVGDFVLINAGETVPSDCKILWGNCTINESIITGETIPTNKGINDLLIGGSIVEDGVIKCMVTAVGKDTVLSKIIDLIKKAQLEKPPIQKLADKISSIFVPTILFLSLLTFLINFYGFNIDFNVSLLRSITVLVISCPCAMGLATPAAIAVGLGRSSKMGVLFKDASCLENMQKIKNIVFDKTGTLTTGKFIIKQYGFNPPFTEEIFKQTIYSILKHSKHPVAVSVCTIFKTNKTIVFNKIEELKGKGMLAIDKDNNTITIGSYKTNSLIELDNKHNLYVIKNNELVGWIDIEDEIRPESFEIIQSLKKLGYVPFILSGDKNSIVEKIANELQITNYYSDQSPENKLVIIKDLMQQKPTMMVGDGINDAPALAAAMVGVSLINASNLSINTAQIVLMKNGLKELPTALALGKATYNTIKSNLFWAFLYNIVAVPIAAIGLLGKFGPTYGALIMALSDVVLIINSLYLFKKKLN
ncbi:MAG: cation-translocating P-type ATPase [Sediminibacterium sp.]|nr:cation-translocating P-type ATPase [Sediminibacterium sp.]